MTDIAQLGIRIDSSEVKTGVSDLDKLTAAGQRAEAMEEGLHQSARATGAAIAAEGVSARQTAADLNAVATSSTAVAQAQARSVQFIKTLRDQLAGFGKSAEELLELQAAELGVTEAARPLIQSLREQRAAQERTAAAAAAEAHALRESTAAKRSAESQQRAFVASLRDQVATQGKSTIEVLRYRAAQLGVSAQSEKYIRQLEATAAAQGKAALTGGQITQAYRQLPAQITDIFTSLASGQPAYLVAIQQGGQLRDSFGGVGATFKALGSILTPTRLLFGGLAVAAGLLVKGAIEGSRETQKLANAIIFTGNAAGKTTDDLREMAQQLDALGGTEAAAAEGLAAFAASGQVAGKNLKEFTRVALELERVAGVAIDETVKQFAELGRSPVESARRLNQQYNFLTLEVYRQIKALEDEGKTREAANLAQETFASALKERTAQSEQNIGFLERAWRGVKTAVKETGDALLDIGRERTAVEQLRELALERERILVSTGGKPVAGLADRLKQIDAEVIAINRRRDAEKATAAEKAKAAESTQRQIEAEVRLAAITAARAAANARTNESAAERGRNAVQRQLESDLQQFEDYNSTIDLLRAADLLNARDYHEEKRRLIQEETAARVKALQAENSIARQQIALARQTAAEQISAAKGLDKEPERIRIQSEADAKVVEIQEKIRDNEQKMFDLRRRSGQQITELSLTQIAASEAVLRSLEDQTEELELQAAAGAHAADEIERLRRAKQLDRAGVRPDERINRAEDRRDGARDKSIVAAARDELILLRLTNDERRLEQASRRLSAVATAEQVQELANLTRQTEVAQQFNRQFEDIKNEFQSFANENILTYGQMYDEIDRRRKADLLSEEEAAEARRLIAQAELQSRIGIAQRAFTALEGLAITGNKRAFKIAKGAAYANAVINTAQAITKAYATSTTIYEGIANAIAIAANLYSQISAIRGAQYQGYMRGGYTGNGSSNAVAGVVHGQEYVLNREATRRIGVSNLDRLQAGASTVDGRALPDYGMWREPPKMTVNVQNYAGARVEAKQISATEIQLMITDSIQKQTPRVVASQIRSPNSEISKSMSDSLLTARKR